MAGRRKNRNPRGEAIAKMILEQYKPENKEEMQDALKDIFGPMFEAMLQGEMDEHLGYESNDHSSKQPTDVTATHRKRLKQAMEKFLSLFPGTENQALNHRLYLNVQRMLVEWKIRYCPCMPKA